MKTCLTTNLLTKLHELLPTLELFPTDSCKLNTEDFMDCHTDVLTYEPHRNLHSYSWISDSTRNM